MQADILWERSKGRKRDERRRERREGEVGSREGRRGEGGRGRRRKEKRGRGEKMKEERKKEGERRLRAFQANKHHIVTKIYMKPTSFQACLSLCYFPFSSTPLWTHGCYHTLVGRSVTSLCSQSVATAACQFHFQYEIHALIVNILRIKAGKLESQVVSVVFRVFFITT